MPISPYVKATPLECPCFMTLEKNMSQCFRVITAIGALDISWDMVLREDVPYWNDLLEKFPSEEE